MSDKTIVILTGAGISAESGLATFRASDGLWCNHRIEDVATPEGFARNPALVHEFYNQRRAQLQQAHPNAAHLALAELAQQWKGRVFLITQNVDDLHEKASAELRVLSAENSSNSALSTPNSKLFHMHGELRKARCTASEELFDWNADMTTQTLCPCCQKPGRLRPHIVWFGEMPLYMDLIQHVLAECDLFLSIGTSGNVYPAAGFVQQARMNGKAHTVELNMEPSSGHTMFHEKIYGPATKTVPEYIVKILTDQIM